MQDFRKRRAAEALENGWTPGIKWTYKVDGKIAKAAHERKQHTRHVVETVIGDYGFADDTGIVGNADEVHAAEGIFITTCLDWCEKVHPNKNGRTETFRER
jgi:hypothetical protein